MTRQLPAYSPISPGALRDGLRAAVAPAEARVRVASLAAETFGAGTTFLPTDSGTAALALALELAAGPAGAGPARTVALPGYACYDLVTATQMARLQAVFYDVDPWTLQPDLASLESACRASPVGAVVVVHLYGVPVDVDAARRIAHAHGARLVEDAAQGVGVRVHGRPAGALGDLAVLSFGRGKGRTGGGGGALLVHAADLIEPARARAAALLPASGTARLLLGTTAQWLFGRPSLYAVPSAIPSLRLGETVYHPPWVAREMPSVAFGVLAATWAAAEREAERRRERAQAWAALLAGHPRWRAVISNVPESLAGVLRLPIVAVQGARAESVALGILPGYPRVLTDLAAEHGVLAAGQRPLPGSAAAAAKLSTLPTHSRLAPSAREAIVTLLTGVPRA